VVLVGAAANRMIRCRSSLILAAGLAVLFEGVAVAEEPDAEEPPTESAAGATAVAPDPAITTAPAPPPTPAPLLPARAAPAASGDGAEAETKILRPDPRFGDAGEVTLNGALSASFGHLGYDTTNTSSTNVNVEPAFDYFSAQSVSEGASVFFRYSEGQSGGLKVDSKTIGATVRVGNNFWLGGRFSFWPKLALGFWRSWLHYAAPAPGFGITIDGISMPIGPDSRFKENAIFIEVQAPFLFHVARHFYLGFGPNGYVDVLHSVGDSKNLRRFFGASSTVGGWF